jgi:hypothetical protein
MVLSGDTLAGSVIAISTFSAVLSSIFFILIFPFSFALIMEEIREVVVVEKGISEIIRVLLSSCEILSLTHHYNW